MVLGDFDFLVSWTKTHRSIVLYYGNPDFHIFGSKIKTRHYFVFRTNSSGGGAQNLLEPFPYYSVE
jgi:hypothetical protein